MGLSFDLGGQSVLVIGASSGVGREVGRLASEAGARVAFAARRDERIREAAEAAPGQAIAVRCDVCREADCARVVEETLAAFGGLDALVYATGMSPLAMLEEASQAEWRSVMDTNVIGAALVTAAALAPLRESRGRAVYVSSYSVRQSLPGLGLYRVSKLALDGLIESWRMEHPDVDFTRAMLGNTVGTEFAESWGPERTAAVTKLWVERNLFPAPNMMTVTAAAEGVLAVLASRGYVDDVAIMPRTRDASARAVGPRHDSGAD